MTTRSKGPAAPAPQSPGPSTSRQQRPGTPTRSAPTVEPIDGAESDATDASVTAKASTPKGPIRSANALVAHHADVVPSSFQEAVESAERKAWSGAMDEEMHSLVQNKTWRLVELPTGRKPVQNRWVFTVKRDRDGRIERYKARLVAKGFTQRKGIDFQETFAPVIRYDSVRILLAVAAHRNMTLTQFDVKTAFLNGEITEEIYMSQPEGYDDGSGKVCRLLKGLYGLKQSPRAWNEKADHALRELGLVQLTADACVYKRTTAHSTLFLALYVDDGLILSETVGEAKELIAALGKRFTLTLSRGDRYIGLEIDQCQQGSIVISQTSYIEEVLDRFNMQDSRPVLMPATPGTRLSSDQCPQTEAEKDAMADVPFKQLIGALMFAVMVTRLDIAFAVHKLAQFFSNPGQQHWQAAKRVLRYLRGTCDMSIRYKATDGPLRRKAYSDSDQNGDDDSLRSTSGVILTLNDSPVVWSSRVQSKVSLSTCESEHRAMTLAIKDVIWTRGMLAELGHEQDGPTPLFCDNQGALKLVAGEGVSRDSRHILKNIAFVRKEAEDETIVASYVPTEDMPADFLTKPVTAAAHKLCCDKIDLKKRSERKLKLKALLTLMLILSNPSPSHAMFDPHPPVIWRQSKLDLINGGELIRIQARIISPCDAYRNVTGPPEQQVERLHEWCMSSFKQDVMDRLATMDEQLVRQKRDFGLTFGAGLAATLFAVPGIGWVLAATTAIVIAGIATYCVLSNRISTTEEALVEAQARAAELRIDLENLQEFDKKVKADLKDLVAAHNNLSHDFYQSQEALPQLLSMTADISSDHALMGDRLEEGIRRWREGKISHKLLMALNISLPCGERCPVKLAEPLSWSRSGDILTLVIVAALRDMSRVALEADPFTLVSFEDGKTCVHEYKGQTLVSVDRESNSSCSVAQVENTYEGILTTTRELPCTGNASNPWSKKVCKDTHELIPQIKRLGAVNVVYCHGLTIRIDGLSEQNCPTYAFTLSVKQSFAIGTYTYTGHETLIPQAKTCKCTSKARSTRSCIPPSTSIRSSRAALIMT